MPALQVRDFPDDLYDELREYAARNHRSIAQQTIACVENELRRSRQLGEAPNKCAGADSGGRIIELAPESVREALERARPVDPWAWLEAFGVESDELRAARLAKREQWRQDVNGLHGLWKGALPTSGETARMIREDRDARPGSIMANVEDYLASKEARA